MEPPRAAHVEERASGDTGGSLPPVPTGLHRSKIESEREIRQLLQRMAAERVRLTRALNRRTVPEIALIERVGDSEMVLRTRNFEAGARGIWRLSAAIDGVPYFFHAAASEVGRSGRARVAIPAIIYQAERRERVRVQAGSDRGPTRVRVTMPLAFECEGEVEDFSPVGLGVRIRGSAQGHLGGAASIEYLDGSRAGAVEYGEIRSVSGLSTGWQRLGLLLVGAGAAKLKVERRDAIVGESRLGRAATQLVLAANAVRASSLSLSRASRSRGRHRKPEIRTVEYKNSHGEKLVGILDTYGEPRGAPVVIIPPAWGKTKETLLPLAATILACFERWKRPVSVLRFDGIRRRGESFNEPDCQLPGKEYLRFSFSQGVRDIRATLDFLFAESDLNPSTAILVSFSAASIDTRRAVAIEKDSRLGGWVSVVGAPDLQSAMKVVSGGIDFLGGAEQGVRFGLQEVQGVLVDMDFAAADALGSRLAFLDDAVQDMAAITQPITWIHGRFDAWMDFERVRLLMSAGSLANRKLIEVPTGHQLRSSVEAIEVFQLIAKEVAGFAGFEASGRAVPNPAALRRRSEAERSRLPKSSFRPREFWKDYLVGRKGNLGIELMVATSAYQLLMAEQARGLELERGHRVVDLGSGTGSLSDYIARSQPKLSVHVTEVDFVPEALKRSRQKKAHADGELGVRVSSIVSDLAGHPRAGVPLADSSQDAALASLLLSYLPQPSGLLKEAWRVLKPGGRLVVSSLRPDADTSRIYEQGVAEIRTGQASSIASLPAVADLGESLRSFLNDAAKLLDLEEQRIFSFFAEDEIRGLIEAAGFQVLRVARAFGNPPQALVVVARKLDGASGSDA